MTDAYADVNGVRLHYVTEGSGPLILFLHGFPEFWYAWRDQLAEFGRDHTAVAVDMRGYNLSSKPDAVEAYRLPVLVEDIRALADHLGAERFVLVGHDWGAGVAWMFAAMHPERLDRLVIINGTHPVIMMRELTHNPAQQLASAYILAFRIPGAEHALSAFNFKALREIVFGGLRDAGHMTEADVAEYVKAWSQPGALTGGLNYYRAANLSGRATSAGQSDRAATSTGSMRTPVPVLVIWGERDKYLLTGNLDGLEEVASDVTIRRIPEGSHWVVHERPAEVNAMIREFIGTS